MVLPVKRWLTSTDFKKIMARMQWDKLLLICAGSVAVMGCRLYKPPSQLPVASSIVLDELVIYSDFQLPENHRLLRDLEAMRERLTTTLALRPSNAPIEVYLFKTPRRYYRFLARRYPDCPQRRAFFAQNGSRLCVYTYWGDQVSEDLSHEVCHGYLHATIPRIPLWIDEGIAEFYEADRGNTGWNPSQYDLLITARESQRWQPDLERLERLVQTESLTEMDYAEAWLWAHFLLTTSEVRKALLREYLADCGRGDVESMSKRLSRVDPNYGQSVQQHLERMRLNDVFAP
tara:strand:- start:287 stop:1153 length:867 start_codon:yes stop_codon:yes gene_type:complete